MLLRLLRRRPQLLLQRAYSQQTPHRTTPPTPPPTNTSATNETPTSIAGQADPQKISSSPVTTEEHLRHLQAPNRATTWSRSQQPRAKAMVGPRFEQTIIEAQPAPWAAIELIHQQPVRWTDSRIVSCDGGGGPQGHPKVFINVDKPEVVPCGYCGLPFAHKHHKEMLEAVGTGYATSA